MDIVSHIRDQAVAAIREAYGHHADPEQLIVQPTRKEFAGHYTLVTFPLTAALRKSPQEICETLGTALVSTDVNIEEFNVVKGFLNLTLSQEYWTSVLDEMSMTTNWWREQFDARSDKVLVEFSSPNTNKPLHLGHIRNILLGWSVSMILEEIGHEVVKVQVINDRGIAICKSMVAWQKFADGATPDTAGVKPDHFVGDWYVQFERAFQDEYLQWQDGNGKEVYQEERNDDESSAAFFKRYKNTYFNRDSDLGLAARNMLQQWEAGDPEVRTLWEQMNKWVYDGFDTTYTRLGVEFDKLYYESQTYLLGRELVEEGLEKGVFYRKGDDGSVWADLSEAGLDQKILLRSDGTSVYITQDLGTAQLRYEDFGAKRMIYVVADEQNYHFKALFECLRMLGMPYADGLYHLSYGMVDLPSGTMKTREGTVVDADDLMDEVYQEAGKAAAERGEIADLPHSEQEDITRKISLAALKYFIIKVDPKKRMTFNPAESVDMQGQTGPYVQNAFVRIKSVLRKAGEEAVAWKHAYSMEEAEIELLRELQAFPQAVLLAAEQYSPAQIANYCYQLAKMFHRYYHEFRILNAETAEARAFRLDLIREIARVLERSLKLLGIQVPERM